MTVLYLIRHGLTDAVGTRLSGRMGGVPLNQQGREQAARLARVLSVTAPAAVYSSPLLRAVETATAIAAPHGLLVRNRDRLTDIDFGAWTNSALSALSADPQFSRFNRQRALTRPPAGESIWEVQTRMTRELLELVETHPSSTVVVVGHADPLRAALCYLLGFATDLGRRFEIRPGSATRIEMNDECTLSLLNYVPGELDDRGGDDESPPRMTAPEGNAQVSSSSSSSSSSPSSSSSSE